MRDRGTSRNFGSSGEPAWVEVWYCATDVLGESELEQLGNTLSLEERQRSGRLRRPADRRDYIVAHALLRTALTKRGGGAPCTWRFEADVRGKPFVAPGQPSFNISLSHTTGFVACAVTCAGPVGIDVERVGEVGDTDLVVRHMLAPTEIEALERCPAEERPSRFVELWTLKEAYLKATGAGLGDGLAHFAIEPVGPGGLRFSPPPGKERIGWHLALFAPSERHWLAVAINSSRLLDYRVRDWSSVPPYEMIRPARLFPAM
jgi:4'-phosphopantetheinyl transferase